MGRVLTAGVEQLHLSITGTSLYVQLEMLSTYSGDDHLSYESEDVEEHEEVMVPATYSFEPDD